ncbi:MAG: hypothetical protein LC130_28155 [Bryobacterales bacterium]|nr:hypothetical protein [Bryobacterales bacterium]
MRVVTQETPCGPDCLLGDASRFTGVIAREGGGFLFRTAANTLVKRKKIRSQYRRFLGVNFYFNPATQQTAFDLLRQYRPPGIVIPLEECSCSYEVPFIEGQPLRTAANPLRSVVAAEAVLLRLHALGIQHGDSGHQNFILSGSDVCLIDLDDIVYTGRGRAGWELATFLRATMVPVLGPRRTLVETCRQCFRPPYIGIRIVAGWLGVNWHRGRRFLKGLANPEHTVRHL